MIRVELFTPSFVRAGPLPVISLNAILRDKDAHGTWSFSMDGAHSKADRIQPGYYIAVLDTESDEVVFGGWITNIVKSAATDSPERLITVSGVTHEFFLYKSVVYPDPARPVYDQTTVNWYVNSGPAESMMHALVNLQRGPGALAPRRMKNLIMSTDQARGPVHAVRARHTILGEDLDWISMRSGLGWRVRFDMVSGTRVFEVFERPDNTRRVQFSRSLGTLGGYSYGLSAPTVTSAAVLGQGLYTDREVREVINAEAEAEWGERVEEVHDRRDEPDGTKLTEAGQDILDEGAPAGVLSLEPIALPNRRYLQILGTKVTAEIEGALIQDIVRQVEISWQAEGLLTIAPTIGNESAPDDPAERKKLERRVRSLSKEIHRLKTTGA